MEARKITVVSTKTQKKSIIMSTATTLQEFKAELNKAGIDYTNMTFYEGITKTELKDDSSLLPRDVMYKGTVTNELVFMLTNSNKKIKSGASISRKEVYDKIKEMNLQDKCLSTFGKNFTMCKTVELLGIIESNKKPMPENNEECLNSNNVSECVDIQARKAILLLLDLLDCTALTKEDIKAVADFILVPSGTCKIPGFKEPAMPSSYTDEQIANMFDFVH